MARSLESLSPAYRRRIERAEAQGKSRQAARGHRQAEHVDRKEKERDRNGGLTLDQVRSVYRWGEKRQAERPSNAALNPDDLVAFAKRTGFDNYKDFKRSWEKQRRNYKHNPRPKGAMSLDDLWDDVDLDDLGVEWLYYH